MAQSQVREVDHTEKSLAVGNDLPAAVVKDLEDAFKMFDRNGDGKISKAELGAVLRSLGDTLTEPELDQMIRDVDVDGDGEIDLQEFIKLNADCVDMKRFTAGGEAASSIEEALQSAFKVFDSDNDGFISAGELHRVLSSLGDDNISLDDCRYMISCVDADGDQLVDFKEFRKLMNDHLAQ